MEENTIIESEVTKVSVFNDVTTKVSVFNDVTTKVSVFNDATMNFPEIVSITQLLPRSILDL